VRIPPGCERELTGTYVHATNPSFRYQARDDGGTLVLDVVRTSPETADGGTADAGTGVGEQPGSGGQRIVLTRTPDGFRGATSGTAYPPGGKSCPVEFPTELTACPEEGLVLISAEEVSVHALSCEPAPSAPRPAMVEQRLLRVQATAPDAGN
jgi:hypothetical protein